MNESKKNVIAKGHKTSGRCSFKTSYGSVADIDDARTRRRMEVRLYPVPAEGSMIVVNEYSYINRTQYEFRQGTYLGLPNKSVNYCGRVDMIKGGYAYISVIVQSSAKKHDGHISYSMVTQKVLLDAFRFGHLQFVEVDTAIVLGDYLSREDVIFNREKCNEVLDISGEVVNLYAKNRRSGED